MRKAIENTTNMPIFVAGMMIPPGETRTFEEDQLPPEHRAAAPLPEAEPEPDHIAELAGQNVDLILPQLAGLSSEDLARLQVLEFEGKARKTVLEGIAAEGLRRAQVQTEGAGDETKTPAANTEGEPK